MVKDRAEIEIYLAIALLFATLVTALMPFFMEAMKSENRIDLFWNIAGILTGLALIVLLVLILAVMRRALAFIPQADSRISPVKDGFERILSRDVLASAGQISLLIVVILILRVLIK